MLRVLGIDPGTISTDLCVLEDGLFAGAPSLATSTLAAEPDRLANTVAELGAFELVAAPSGYGLPLLRGEELDERLLRLAFLAPAGEPAGILGLRREAVVSGRLSALPQLVGALGALVHETLGMELVAASAAAAPAGSPPTHAAALGAALLADGLCGGKHAPLVEALRLREASGSALDHLYVPAARAGAARFM